MIAYLSARLEIWSLPDQFQTKEDIFIWRFCKEPGLDLEMYVSSMVVIQIYSGIIIIHLFQQGMYNNICKLANLQVNINFVFCRFYLFFSFGDSKP